MKIYAFFLPQFYEIPENDKWWGEGFTEWTNVRRAAPLFKKHKQPIHPLNDNYYNLLDKKTVIWQTNLLNKFNIDGLIYYHYYFNGKLLLEKPAENLLHWKDIDQKFFFCWANHTWTKTWNGSKQVLIEQTYGNKNDWEKHFQYLLTFFRDSRYQKINNKPMFMVFKSSFPEKTKMFKYFNERCKDEGFDGIFLIESYHGDVPISEFGKETSDITSMIYYREPAVSRFRLLRLNNFIGRNKFKIIDLLRKNGMIKRPEIDNGNVMMKRKIGEEPLGSNVGHGLWFQWDNTPRHKQRGYIITAYKKELFTQYMNLIKNEDYLFINAWNEWCEGMILEPTEEYGYKYLQWVKEWREMNE